MQLGCYMGLHSPKRNMHSACQPEEEGEVRLMQKIPAMDPFGIKKNVMYLKRRAELFIQAGSWIVSYADALEDDGCSSHHPVDLVKEQDLVELGHGLRWKTVWMPVDKAPGALGRSMVQQAAGQAGDDGGQPGVEGGRGGGVTDASGTRRMMTEQEHRQRDTRKRKTRIGNAERMRPVGKAL